MQLGSSRPEVVAWAAWRIADERVEDLNFDVRRAAVRWSQVDDESSAARKARACLLDVLIQFDVRLAPSEFDAWRERSNHHGALLVLAARADPIPEPLLFEIFDNGNEAQCVAAGDMLVSRRSASAIEGLLQRCRMLVRVDVVDSNPSEPRAAWDHDRHGAPLDDNLPPLVVYVWTLPSESGFSDAGHAQWTRVPDRSGHGRAPRFPPRRLSAGETALQIARRLAGDVLPESARTDPQAVSTNYRSDEELRRIVDDALRAARERWLALLQSLIVRDGVSLEVISARYDPIELHVRDRRRDKEPPLPEFER